MCKTGNSQNTNQNSKWFNLSNQNPCAEILLDSPSCKLCRQWTMGKDTERLLCFTCEITLKLKYNRLKERGMQNITFEEYIDAAIIANKLAED